jgi:hypothetical protein
MTRLEISPRHQRTTCSEDKCLLATYLPTLREIHSRARPAIAYKATETMCNCWVPYVYLNIGSELLETLLMEGNHLADMIEIRGGDNDVSRSQNPGRAHTSVASYQSPRLTENAPVHSDTLEK